MMLETLCRTIYKMIQVLVGATRCRFDSCYPHQKIQVLGLGFFICCESNGILSPAGVFCFKLYFYLNSGPFGVIIHTDLKSNAEKVLSCESCVCEKAKIRSPSGFIPLLPFLEALSR